MNSTGSDTKVPNSRPFITMGRINTLIALVFLITTLSGCSGCNGCKGCQTAWCRFTSFLASECTKFCTIRVQFFDEQTGLNLTNVHSSSFLDFDLINGGDVRSFVNQPVNSDGTLEVDLNPCFDLCKDEFLTAEVQLFGARLHSQEDCPAGLCRQWTMNGASNMSPSHFDGCTLIVRVPVTKRQGPCRPC